MGSFKKFTPRFSRGGSGKQSRRDSFRPRYREGERSPGRFGKGRGRRPEGEFGRDSERPERRSFGNRDSEKEMFTVNCDKCGQMCEVPFRPTGGKPVYCSNCFRKEGDYESKSYGKYQKDFRIINEKLDSILEALGKQ